MALVLRPLGPSKPDEAVSHFQAKLVDVTFDSSLLAGGEAQLTAANVGMTTILGVIEVSADVPAGVIFKYDLDGELLTAFQTKAYAATTVAAGALAQATAIDLSASICRFLVIGI